MVSSNTLVMSDIERIVYDYLTNHGIEFQFQTSLSGGWYSLGGAVVDFLFEDRRLAWRIQGEYYHKGVEKEGSDIVQRELLENMGWIVVDIWGDDIKDPTRLEQTMRLALQGREVLR